MLCIDLGYGLNFFIRGDYKLLKIINNFVRFEVFMAVAMKNAVLRDVTARDSCNNRRFGGS
jgi:hypothetical protein